MASKFVVFCSILSIAKAGVLSPVRYTATPAVAVSHKVAYANPAVDAVASTHQNVVRSFDGTVSTYSKAVDTPYSSVHKVDTRISNNVYAPAYAKSVAAYTAVPVPAKSLAYEAAPLQEKHTYAAYAAAPVTKSISYAVPHFEKASVTYDAPAVLTKTLTSTPVTSKSLYAVHAVPSHAVHAAPAHAIYAHSATPSADLYTHAIPKAVVEPIATYAVAKPVAAYTPAAAVATTSYNHGPAATTYTHNAPGLSAYGSSQTVHYSPAEMVSHMSFDGFGTHWGY